MNNNTVQDRRNRFFGNFNRYRRGLSFSNKTRIRTFRPLAGNPFGVYRPSNVRPAVYPYVVEEEDKVDLDKLVNWKGQPSAIVDAYQSLQRLKHFFMARSDARRFRYRRCLGWGGQGLAAGFDLHDGYGRRTGGIVVKNLFYDDPEISQGEIDALMKHEKSEHIVQLVTDLMDNGRQKKANMRQSNTGRSYLTGYNSQPQAPTMIILEWLENGDLANFISKVREKNQRIPNRVLWAFLLCMTRMCIGLAYPRDAIPGHSQMASDIRESTFRELRAGPSSIVHFDLDPRNIFLGNMTGAGGREHRISPKLKLGDFGMATEIERNQPDEYYESFRNWGKYGFYSPEQFCQEWDYIPRDQNLVNSHPVAGNYSWHSNVWAVGLVMETLITLCYPISPPMAAATAVLTPWENGNSYWTYGAHLQTERFRYVDRNIIGIVMRCQAHVPMDRPALRELEGFVSSKLQNQYVGESDQQISDWMNGILYDAPPNPPPHPPSNLPPNLPPNLPRPFPLPEILGRAFFR